MASKKGFILILFLYVVLFFLIGLIVIQFRNPAEDIFDEALKTGKLLEIINYK